MLLIICSELNLFCAALLALCVVEGGCSGGAGSPSRYIPVAFLTDDDDDSSSGSASSYYLVRFMLRGLAFKLSLSAPFNVQSRAFVRTTLSYPTGKSEMCVLHTCIHVNECCSWNLNAIHNKWDITLHFHITQTTLIILHQHTTWRRITHLATCT